MALSTELSSMPPSSSGLGHHPFKVAARVRIPLGVPRGLNAEDMCESEMYVKEEIKTSAS